MLHSFDFHHRLSKDKSFIVCLLNVFIDSILISFPSPEFPKHKLRDSIRVT